jgi:hypothetical protein
MVDTINEEVTVSVFTDSVDPVMVELFTKKLFHEWSEEMVDTVNVDVTTRVFADRVDPVSVE